MFLILHVQRCFCVTTTTTSSSSRIVVDWGGGHEKSFQGVLAGGSEISKNPLFLHYKIV